MNHPMGAGSACQQGTSIHPSAVQDLFDSASNAAAKGQAQFLTPIAFGQALVAGLPEHRPTIVDLTCGPGQLLQAAANTTTRHLLGADIQKAEGRRVNEEGRTPDGAKPLPHSSFRILPSAFIHADVTKLYPFLVETDWKADLFVLNPPWDLHWYRDRLALLAESEIEAVRTAFSARDPRLSADCIDSTVATLMIALDRCTYRGEGFLIANEATLQRLVFGDGAPYSSLTEHIWHHAVYDGNAVTGRADGAWDGKAGDGRWEMGDGDPTAPSTPSAICHLPSATAPPFRTGVIYFARSHHEGPGGGSQVPERPWQKGAEVRHEYHVQADTPTVWAAVREEWRRLEGLKVAHPYNLWIENGVIRTALSTFQDHSKKVNKTAARQFHDLNGRRPMELVLQRNTRELLFRLTGPANPQKEAEQAKAGGKGTTQPDATAVAGHDGSGELGRGSASWRVDPALLAEIDRAWRDYQACRAPLYPLPKIQRLGYLEEEDSVLVQEDLEIDGVVVFARGQWYPLRTRTISVTRRSQKLNLAGEPEDLEFTGQELATFVTDARQQEHCFLDARALAPGVILPALLSSGEPLSSEQRVHTLSVLVDHFAIPDVADVAAADPERFQLMLGRLAALQEYGELTLKPFQLQDLSRAALHDGLILGWDTGLGKTLAGFLWPLLKLGWETRSTDDK